jgi:hypothetical protein
MYRGQKARRLEERSREIERERRKAFAQSAFERDEGGHPSAKNQFEVAAERSDWWNPKLASTAEASAAARWLRANVARYKLAAPPRPFLPARAERDAKGRPVKGNGVLPAREPRPGEPLELVCTRCEHVWQPVEEAILDVEAYRDPKTLHHKFAKPFGASAKSNFFKPKKEERPDHTCPNCGAQPDRGELEGSRWHLSRADGVRTVFKRVKECAEDPRKLVLTCRNSECRNRLEIKMGCDSQMFCLECRQRRAQDFRHDFNRKRLGLMNSARLSGLRDRALDRQAKRLAKEELKARFRERAHRMMRGQPLAELTDPPQLRDWREFSHRMGERMLSLTIPDEGSPEHRIDVLEKTWKRFWRLFRQEYRPRFKNISTKLRADAEAKIEATPGMRHDPKTGEELANGETLSMWDLFHYLWVLEWTPGKDGNGHPHLHVWLFSTFLPDRVLRALWNRAYAEVTDEKTFCRLLVIDIRAPEGDKGDFDSGIDSELVKYLTKDWSEDGVRRLSPAIYGRIYKRLDGRRRRQTSAGLGNWTLAEHKACACCYHESSPFRHWAFVSIEAPLQRKAVEPATMLVFPDLAGVGPPLAKTRGAKLREAWDEQREREWFDSPERLQLARFMKLAVSLKT